MRLGTMLAAAAAAVCARTGVVGGRQHERHLLRASADVRTLDDAAAAALRGSVVPNEAVFLMIEPLDTAACEGCEAMATFWSMAAAHIPASYWRMSCRPQPELCNRLGLDAVPPSANPEFAAWSGDAFEVYRGPREPSALKDFIVAEAKAWASRAKKLLRARKTAPAAAKEDDASCEAEKEKEKEERNGKEPSRHTLEDRGDGYRQCTRARGAAGPGDHREEGVGLSLTVLTGSYIHPNNGRAMLTPQLRLSYASWAKSELLESTRERVLFIQEIRVEHCDQVFELTAGGASFVVVGNVEQVGIPNGQAYLFRTATSSRLLFLEHDFAVLDDRPSLQAHLYFAEAALGGGGGTAPGGRRRSTGAGVVLLRGCCGHRNGGETDLSSTAVCDWRADDRPLDEHPLRLASETDVVWTTPIARAFSPEKCAAGSKLRWDPPGLFFTSNTAFEFCRVRAEAEQLRVFEGLPSDSDERRNAFAQDSMVRRCSPRDPLVYCHRSLTAHWTNNAWMANRAFVLAELLPRYPDCQRAPKAQRAFCNYLGVESNRELQCHLRSLNYTVWQTEGAFRHLLEERSSDMGPCDRGEGNVVEEPGGRMECEAFR